MSERPCDSEPLFQDDVPQPVLDASARLLELFHKSLVDPAAGPAGVLDGETLVTLEVGDDGEITSETDLETEVEIEVVEEEFFDEDAPVIQVRSVVRQPELPRIFKLIITNYNARQALLAKTRIEREDPDKPGDMSQAEWRQFKELYRDMRQSLRPAAEKAVSYDSNS